MWILLVGSTWSTDPIIKKKTGSDHLKRCRYHKRFVLFVFPFENFLLTTDPSTTDMLPTLLSTNLCSLLCDADRLAMSVTWECDAKTFQLLPNTTWFGRTVIRSKYALSYVVVGTPVGCVLRLFATDRGFH